LHERALVSLDIRRESPMAGVQRLVACRRSRRWTEEESLPGPVTPSITGAKNLTLPEYLMRRLFRTLVPVVAAAAIALGGASSVFAAGAASSASLDASFCYPTGATTICYDIDGSIHFVDTAAGSSYTLQKIVRTTEFENGVEVGSAMSTQIGRGVFQADGTVVIDTIINTRSSLDGEPCTYRLIARLVDYEAVVFQTVNTCL
jgi:hypothetical protein